MSKKLINDPNDCVDEMLAGIVAALPGLDLHARHRVVMQRKKFTEPKVALVSGGGSGHEPFCAGYVGSGMLTAICAGSVFASPPASNVLHAIKCTAKLGASGTLVVIPNYTGDCLNFGLAIEKAQAQGMQVNSVVVAEDCALLNADTDSQAGRRGMCGLLFVFKIAGALAETKAALAEVAAEAQNVVENMATLGVSLSACSLPGAGPLFTLKDDEMELGLGIHGEAGIERMKLCTANEIVNIMLDRIIKALHLASGDCVAVLVNNLGATCHLEQALIGGIVKQGLVKRGLNPLRLYAGHLMTSLNMTGIQLCLLKLSPDVREKWLKALDVPTNASAWPGCELSLPCDLPHIPEEEKEPTINKDLGPQLGNEGKILLIKCLEAVATAFKESEVKLNELDSGCGDGDCGSTLRRLADEILLRIKSDSLHATRPAALLYQLSNYAENLMGGTSGAIYSLFLTKAATCMSKESSCTTGESWAKAWRGGIDGIMAYSTARIGHRTMLDALDPACREFEKFSPKKTMHDVTQALTHAAASAKSGCEATKNMKAKAGRASYVDPSHLIEVDAGAYAVTVWLDALLNEFNIALMKK